MLRLLGEEKRCANLHLYNMERYSGQPEYLALSGCEAACRTGEFSEFSAHGRGAIFGFLDYEREPWLPTNPHDNARAGEGDFVWLKNQTK
jgi:hypothetical protein